MVSSCLRRTLRSYDTIARFGGDEFAAICVDCDREKVVHPIRRLQEAIKSISVPSASGRHTVTLSIGIAVIHSGFEHRTPQDLIALADACLYQAKRSGRDGAFLSELRSDTSDVPEDLAAYEANTAPVLV
jgi:diguanylate cyclase (GGDEF)-like protein